MQNIIFKTLSWRNFLSYGNNITTIHLDNIGTTHIEGKNGAGKTVILNALSYVLYDKPVTNISKDDLVNNINKKNMEVSLTFTKGTDTYTIRRERKTKSGSAGNNTYIFINDEDKTPAGKIVNTVIEKLIGMPYELFVRIVVFSAGYVHFLDLPARHESKANQTDFIEELFGFTQISEKSANLKKIISETEKDLQFQKSKIQTLENEHARHQQMLQNTQTKINNWDTQTKAEIVQLTKKLKELKSINADRQLALHNELNTITPQITPLIKIKKQCESVITNLTTEISKQQQSVAHLQDSKCPYCLQHYTNATNDIASINILLTDNESKLILASTELTTISAELLQLQEHKKSITNQITVNDYDKLTNLSTICLDTKNKLIALKNAKNPYTEVYDEMNKTVLPIVDYTEINTLSKEIDHQKFLLKLLTKKDSFVRKTLLAKHIPFLNSKLQEYLSELQMPHKVEFTQEMTANVSQFGRELSPGNLSTGQKNRINFALSLAFSDVLQTMHPRVNARMFDEILDNGLDREGIVLAANLLRKKATQDKIAMFIVSHREEADGSFDRTMKIQLTNGFSTIEHFTNE